MQYDLIIIGGGPGGYVAAIHASQLGLKTALVEKNQLGGTCLNRGCIPTKTLMHTAELYREACNFSRLGINVSELSFDYAKMQQRKDEVTGKLRAGVAGLLQANKVTVINGEALITQPGQIKVGDDIYQAPKILVAAGSYPARPPIPGLDLPHVITSDELLGSEGRFYERLVIIGGGVIGIEMASVYSALGSKVTVIEALERILPTMDREISQNMNMIMKKRGTEVFTSARVAAVEHNDADGLLCRFLHKDTEKTVEADAVLVAVGRRPAGGSVFAPELLDTIEMERGFCKVDEHFQTSVPGIFAIGDATRGYQLAHAAEAQGIAAVEYMCGAATPSVDPALVPACVYTVPEIAVVGLTAEEAKAAGIQTMVGKYLMSGNAKSIIEEQERSFVKLIFAAADEKIIGAQLMCARATDMIGELTTAISAGLTRRQMLAALRPHPTFSEAISEALEAADGHSIHSLPGRK